MDLDRSMLEMIDEYISDALAVTGTRRAPRSTQPMPVAAEPEVVQHDFPEIVIAEEIEPLPRARAPRSTVDLDDEITDIVKRPPQKA